MTLQKLIERVKSELREQNGFPAVEIEHDDIRQLCEAAELMREELALMAEGEGPGEKVYMAISKAAITKADQICGKE